MSKRQKKKEVIPGKRLTMGITISMLSLLILIPLSSVLVKSFQLTLSEFIEVLSRNNVRQAFITSIVSALIAALIYCVLGLILAWILVKYDFRGKKVIDSMIELPFALPTSVAGITLSKMYSDQGFMGQFLANFGIEVSYTKLGIVIALVFVGIPFVVRSLQPVIEKLPDSYNEAAVMMGAGPVYTFRRVILPELTPALLSGFGLAFARGLGEYGSVIYISGNREKNGTQVGSYIIMQKLNSGNVDYEGAAAIALVLLVVSFAILLVINILQILAARRTSE